MPIPQSQLETWSNQGAKGLSSAAYASVRHSLEKATSPLAGRGIEIYLQGSYANETHIYADSDIDVVVYYGKTFHSDLSALAPNQQELHQRVFPTAPYQWSHLRDDVLAALRSHYGLGAVSLGKKAIKVQTGHGRMVADVVPAVEFRRYATFPDQNTFTAHWGICLFDSAGNQIVNYPKYHIQRGEDKNSASRTRGQYKPTVRIFKNLRNYLVESALITQEAAPSYYVECALHKVPDNLFVGRYADTVPAILNYLVTTPYAGFMCQNGVTPLIGTGSTQWPKENFAAFVVTARDSFQNW